VNLSVSRKRNVQYSVTNRVSLMLAIVPLWLMIAAAVPATGQTSSATSSPADWTQFLRDNMQRWNPYETILGVNNVGSLQLKWSYTIENNAQVSNSSSPAVVNGVVYLGSSDHNVYALNAGTGAKLWSFATGDRVFSSPAVANGVVFVGSTDSSLYALNASTGAKLWSYATGAGVVFSPAVANGVVYFDSADHNVYALNASTGAKLWSYATPSSPDCSPAVANGIVYIDNGYGTVLALDANTGAEVWSFNTDGDFLEGSFAVANGVVYACTDNTALYALNASTGAKLWSYSNGAGCYSAPAVANGVVYFLDGNVNALNASTGVKLWSSPGGDYHSSPAVANGVVLCQLGRQCFVCPERQHRR